MPQPLLDLIEISRFAGEHPRLVQGGGGNCSVKSAGKMWVKASGCMLKDVSEEKGYAVVDLSGNPVDESRGKASMETPLHTLLGSFVIHTHPVAVAALVASVQGRRFFRKIFSQLNYYWIDYATPGRPLYQKVKAGLPANAARSDVALFLKNHGLFVSSPNKVQAMQLHANIVETLEKFFGAAGSLPEIPEGKYLTPDHAVYGSAAAKGKPAAQETASLVRGALAFMDSKHWSPEWLSGMEAKSLQSMESERYRLKQL